MGNSRRVLVSELSGRSNIAAVVKHPDIKQDRALQEKVLSEICRLENEGWQFEAAEATFDLLVERVAGSRQYELVHVGACEGPHRPTARRSITCRIGFTM